jgi:hypothetical protein
MRKLFRRYLLIGLLCAGSALSAAASVVYDNTSNDLATRFEPGLLEVGDQIILAGADRSITNFAVEYWGEAAFPPLFSGPVEVKVAFMPTTAHRLMAITLRTRCCGRARGSVFSPGLRATLWFTPRSGSAGRRCHRS